MDGARYYDYQRDESWGPRFDGEPYAPFYAWDPTDERFGKLVPYSAVGNDNILNLYRTGVTNTTNVSFAHSGDQYSTRISFTNIAKKGVVPNSDATRRYFTLKTTYRPMKRLTVNLDWKYVYRNNHNSADEGYGSTVGTVAQWYNRNVDVNDLKDYKRPDGTFKTWNIRSITNLKPMYANNPFALYNEINYNSMSQWNVISGDVIYDITSKIKASFTINANIENTKKEKEVPGNLSDYVSSYSQDQTTMFDLRFQGKLSYSDRFIRDRLSLDAALFAEDREYQYDQVGAFTRDGLFMDKFFSVNGSVGLPGGSNYKEKRREQSVYGLITLGFDDTYYFEINGRNDWMSTLHPDQNSFLYGGFSFSMIASNWFKADWLNFWKLRTSAAQVGSTLNPYNIFPTYSVTSGGRVLKYGSTGLMWNNTVLNNPLIKPTISTSWEVGTEFRMFDNRFWGDINFYNRDSRNQIINLDVTPASGYYARTKNAGLIRNRGWEFSLGGEIVRSRNWSWELNTNLSFSKNSLVELDASDPDTKQYTLYWTSWGGGRIYSFAEVGKPIGAIYGNDFLRSDSGELLLARKHYEDYAGSMSQEAFNKFCAKYGEYDLMPDSKPVYVGNLQPKMTGGLYTTLRYKGLSLSAALDFQVGGTLISITNMFGEAAGQLASTSYINDRGKNVRDWCDQGGGVKVTGVDSETGQPVSTYMDAQEYFGARGYYVWTPWAYDASYVKLRELSLAYALPAKLLKKIGFIKTASISLIAQNPWLIYSAVPNIDASESGAATRGYIEGGQALSVRSFGATVSFTF